MQDDREKRPTLKSSTELKGKKANAPKRRVNRFIPILICIVLVAGGLGLYYFTDVFAPDEEAQESVDQSPEYVKTTLIDRSRAELDRLHVSIKDGDAYTLVSHVQYDEEGNAIDPNATPEPAEGEAPEATAEPDEGEAPDADAPEATPEPEPAEVIPNYTVEGKPYFRLNESSITSMMSYAVALEAQHTVEENAQDLSIYGLNDPKLTVTAEFKDGAKETIYFGDKMPSGTYQYALKEGDPNVYILLLSVGNAYTKTLNSLHTVESPEPIAAEQIDTLLIEQEGKETIELKYLETSDNALGINLLKLVQPIDYDAHSTRGQEMLDGAIAMALNGYAGHAETDEELQAFGLLTPRAHVRVTSKEGQVFDVQIGAQDGVNSYVRIDDTGDIYTMSNSSLSFIGNASVAYLADQFTNLVNIMKVEDVIIEGNGETYTMHMDHQVTTKEDGTEQTVSTYSFDGEPVEDESLFKKLYQEVIGTLLDRVSDNYNHEGDIVARVTYKVNTGDDDFVVEYLEYDKDYYAVKRDGMTIFLIKQNKVQAMLDACRQYREGTFVAPY